MDEDIDMQHLTAARYKIEDLLRFVQQGKVRVPRFQRPLRWTADDVEKLFDSIYKGFPIGTLLFWVRDAEADTVELGPVTILAPRQTEANWVVDGQQRITALAASLLPATQEERDPRFEISFDLEREIFSKTRPGDSDTRLPVRTAHDLQRVLAWLRERDIGPRLQDRAFRLADKLRNYELPAYLVTTDNEEALQVIFDRTNTFGKSMTRAEVFRALNTSSGEPRSDIGTLDTEITALGFGSLPGNTLLYSVLAARAPDVLREFRSEFSSSADQIDALEKAKIAIEKTAEFLRDQADVPHFSLVPYQHQTVGLVRFFALHPHPDSQIVVLLRRWFWRATELGPIARLGNTGTLRATTGAIQPGDSYKSVSTLLDLSEASGPPFDIGNYRWTSASTRASVCALAHLRPRAILESSEIDVTQSVDTLGREALASVVDSRSPGRLRKAVANRMFVSVGNSVSESEIQDALAYGDSETARSHCVNEAALQMLAAGNEDGFLKERAISIERLVRDFLSARAERTAKARPSIDSLVSPGE